MSIIKHLDKRTGTVYVYESESYWDKEKQQPRARRKLIGKLDKDTGEIIPTGKSGRKKAGQENRPAAPAAESISGHIEVIAQKDASIKELKAEIARLKKEKADVLNLLQNLCSRLSD